MNRLILAFFLFISFNGISQLSTFEKKGKIGLKNGEEILLKPKYDSILPHFAGDSTIRRVYVITIKY